MILLLSLTAGCTQANKSNEITENLAFFAISVGNISVNDKKIPSVVLDYFILNNKFRNYKFYTDKYTLSIELFREILSIINDLINLKDFEKSQKNIIEFSNTFLKDIVKIEKSKK